MSGENSGIRAPVMASQAPTKWMLLAVVQLEFRLDQVKALA
jgi:hypothetical protein